MRHKLISSRWKLTAIFFCIFLTLNTMVFGVPLSMSYSNQENIKSDHFAQEKDRDDKKLAYSSCILNGSKYDEGEHVSGAGPCEECICHPPNVVCSMMKCPTNSGCITIQIPNKCCPTYKCDCEHNGKLYNNGEKIMKSDESACKVCFCNGGEIVCTSIVCYTRNDCQGYFLPGDCCPKYDNCSSTSTEQKPKESIDIQKSSGKNIQYWAHSTEQNYNVDSIWKRDTEKSEKQEPSTVPNIVTIPSTLYGTGKASGQINISIPHELFEEIDVSTSNSILEKNITFNETNNNEINTPYSSAFSTTVDDLNITEDLNISFLGFETGNLTTNVETIDFSVLSNNETSEILPEFEELFDTTIGIDNSVVIMHQNGTETIIGVTEAPVIEENIDLSTEATTSTQIEIFDPNELIMDTEQPMPEFSTITSVLDLTTEIDYEGSREATTHRSLDKSTITTPYKLVMNTSQKSIEDEINTENTFTDLQDTTDMFGPNFGHHSQKTPINSENTKLNIPSFSKTKLTKFENISEIINDSSQNELFSKTITRNVDPQNITEQINEATEIYNDNQFLELKTNNITECVNNSCANNSILNDELLNSQTEPTSTTPFIIETKVLPNQASPRLVIKNMPYPKEYPEEFETIQNGPSLTITKRTYTSIPDIVYTTTTMITLPTLDLIYKADKEIEKYLSEMQSTTIKPSNNLSPLRNVSILSST